MCGEQVVSRGERCCLWGLWGGGEAAGPEGTELMGRR